MKNMRMRKAKFGVIIVVAIMTLTAFGIALAHTNNNPPDPPEIEGPTSGKIWTTYLYNITITDPDGDNMQQLEVDFGDGDITLFECGCTEPLWESGDTLEIFNSWKKSGNYVIQARVMDIYGAWSDWGSLEVSMPKKYHNPLRLLFEKLNEWFMILFEREILPGFFNL